MFRMPTRGFAVSVEAHRCDLESFADWVEASVLFLGEDVTRSDLVDRLLENSVYRSQDFAHRWLDTVIAEIRRRLSLLGGATPLVLDTSRLLRKRDWKEYPAYAFCIALAIQIHYRAEVEADLGKQYHIQGQLFEELILELMRANHWSAIPAGWSHKTATSIEEKIGAIATAIGERQLPGAVAAWTEPHAKDSGLDVVAWQPFPDGWSGRPICLMQCASGEDWDQKLATPDLNTWCHLIDFATKPRRGLAMPFAPEADEFRRRAGRDGVILLLDRHRLMHTSGQGPYPTPKLSAKLIQWTEERIKCFPRE